jgi:hypothetical protein
MLAELFHNVILDRKCPFYVVIGGNSAKKKISSPKLARQDFLRQIFARSLKRLGTTGTDY